MKKIKISRSFLNKIGIMAIALFLILDISCKKKLEKITSDAIYVANEDGATVSVIDAESGKVIKEIELKEKAILKRNRKMPMAHNIQVAPNGKTVWVTGVPMEEGDEEQVIVIDTKKNKVTERIKVGKEQHLAHVVLDDDSRYAYVTGNESNQIIKINVSTMKVETHIDLGSGHKPHGLRYFNGKLYVANMDAKSVSVVDVNSSQIDEIPLGGVVVQTAVTPDGQYAFASLYDTREVARISIHTGAVTIIPLPIGSEGPIQLYSTPNSKLLYVCDQGGLLGRNISNKVYVIDIASSTIINTIVTGNKAHGVVVDDDGNKAYVTNSDDNTVSVIDIASQTVINTISVGKSPNGIGCWHSKGNTWGGKH